MEEDDEAQILRLRDEGKWEEIIEKFDKNKFLPWVWPEKKNLEFIGKAVRNQNSNSLISIGCGSGLLEWLLATATGMEVTGIETDGNWWKSRYSSGTFIPMLLVEDSKRGDFGVATEGAVLFFCYFNNLQAFLNYVSNFKGNCFIAPKVSRQGLLCAPVISPHGAPKGLHQLQHLVAEVGDWFAGCHRVRSKIFDLRSSSLWHLNRMCSAVSSSCPQSLQTCKQRLIWRPPYKNV